MSLMSMFFVLLYQLNWFLQADTKGYALGMITELVRQVASYSYSNEKLLLVKRVDLK